VASEPSANDRAATALAVPVDRPAVPPAANTAPAVVEAVAPPVVAPPVVAEKRREAEDDLGPQLALIDGARAALAQGNARDALARLKEYESRYPAGALGLEASALRVEALLRAGDRSRGQALGEKFVSQHPNGPYTARIRTLLSQAR
jgi:hypothetical protein